MPIGSASFTFTSGTRLHGPPRGETEGGSIVGAADLEASGVKKATFRIL